jgi:hypothetical protein
LKSNTDRMLRKFLPGIFLLFFITGYAQTIDNKRIIFHGIIKDSTNSPVSYAHILVKNRNEGYVGDYYGNFQLPVFPGDTLIISAVPFYHSTIIVPNTNFDSDYLAEVILHQKVVYLKELTVRPWPATYEQLKRDFMKVEVEDPLANLDLHLPSPEELKMLSYSLEGGFGVRVPLISMIYNQFSREAKMRQEYTEAMNREKAYKRYNSQLVSRITGIKNPDELGEFMAFCALQIKFILESTDYDLYAAILNCYDEFCKEDLLPETGGE